MGRKIMELRDADPKWLIRESYRIEGITEGECRSIFTDWALSLPVGLDPLEAMRVVLATYEGPADHPMTRILTEGLTQVPQAPRRRGGRAAKFAP